MRIHSTDPNGLLAAKLFELGSIGIEEGSNLTAFFEGSVPPDCIRHLFPDAVIDIDLPSVFTQEALDPDPVYAATRFVIVPVSRAEAQHVLTPDLIVLAIDAAIAFGSGRHETTQLCLQALEQLVQPNSIVFDLGCGSGILALAAQQLGAARVVAADIDELAVAVARKHVQAPLFVGSANAVASAMADLVICNITGPVDDWLAFDLKRILRPTGRAIVSGFTSATAPQSFVPETILYRDDWLCWICKAASIVPLPQSATRENPTDWWL